ELRVLPDHLVADGRLEGLAVPRDPVPEVEGDERLGHGGQESRQAPDVSSRATGTSPAAWAGLVRTRTERLGPRTRDARGVACGVGGLDSRVGADVEMLDLVWPHRVHERHAGLA